jgi:hypothetical protein
MMINLMAVQIQRNDTIQQLVDKDIRLIHDGVLGDIVQLF